MGEKFPFIDVYILLFEVRKMMCQFFGGTALRSNAMRLQVKLTILSNVP